MTVTKIHTLSIIAVGELEGSFHIPDYQRGYRWQRRQVEQLIDDVMRQPQGEAYYLQPITVTKREKDKKVYDLIDGQQRLTTLLLIYKALQQKAEEWSSLSIIKREDVTEKYEICYDTRTGSETFIKEIANKSGEDAAAFPDNLYMWHAYHKIKNWLDTHSVPECISLANKISKDVMIIWYEVGDGADDAWSTFANLNSGKIPLTNSELVKALFLCSANDREIKRDYDDEDSSNEGLSSYEKSAIVEQWDGIERELSTPAFWAFLSNDDMNSYPTKIDLLLDIVAEKPQGEVNEFYTFAYFENKYKGGKIGHEEWQKIYDQYLKLRDWYEDNNIFHKMGYLIAVEAKSLRDLYSVGCDMFSTDCENKLDQWIRDSIAVCEPTDLEALDYNDKTHNKLIERLLTLLNIISILQLKDNSLRYPLHLHKDSERRRGGWSLEHINAQNSEQIRKEGKKIWLDLHAKSLDKFAKICKLEYQNRYASTLEEDEKERLNSKYNEIGNNIKALQKDLCSAMESKDLGDIKPLMDRFAKIVVPPFSNQSEEIYRDGLANMALITKDDNAVLNNSVFDVKRMIIFDSMADSYIPPFTQKVFAKSFCGSDVEQLYFWSHNDRMAYLKEIKRFLKPYLVDNRLPLRK